MIFCFLNYYYIHHTTSSVSVTVDHWVDLIKETSGDWVWQGTRHVEALDSGNWEVNNPVDGDECAVIKLVNSELKLSSSVCSRNLKQWCMIRFQ